MGANNTTQFFDNLPDALGKSFNHTELSLADDCCMSDKAIMYAADELGADEIHEFTAHLQHCRFCVDLILDLRMAEAESRVSAGGFVEVLPALAEAVNQSSRMGPARPFTEKISAMFSKARSALTLPKLLVPLATACLIFMVMQSGLKDTDIALQHEVLRNGVGTPGRKTAPAAGSPSMSPDNGEPTKRATSEKHDKSKPPETLYSMAPSLKAKPESPAPALKRKKRTPRSPLERLNLDRLKLVGIVRSPDGNKAIVEDRSGKGHILTAGSYIGTNGGRVMRIENDRVVIAEKFEDEFGRIKTKQTILRLPFQNF